MVNSCDNCGETHHNFYKTDYGWLCTRCKKEKGAVSYPIYPEDKEYYALPNCCSQEFVGTSDWTVEEQDIMFYIMIFFGLLITFAFLKDMGII